YVDADRRPVVVAESYTGAVGFHPVWIIRRFRRLASLVVTGSLPDDSLAPLQPELLWAQRLRVVVAVDDDKLAALTRYLHIAYGERAASVLSVLVADTTLSVLGPDFAGLFVFGRDRAVCTVDGNAFIGDLSAGAISGYVENASFRDLQGCFFAVLILVFVDNRLVTACCR